MNVTSPNRQYSAVLLDLYGTLFSVASINRICQRVTDHPSDLSRLWRSKQLEYTFLRSSMGQFVDFDTITADALDYALAALRLRADATQRQRLANAWLTLRAFPDVPKALEQLAQSGMPLAVLSNGTEQSINALLEQAGLRGSVSGILSSDRARAYKPSPAIYELGNTFVSADPANILMVSSNGFDVAGAKSFGFSVCRVDRLGLPMDPLGFEPDLTVRTFAALVDNVLGVAR